MKNTTKTENYVDKSYFIPVLRHGDDTVHDSGQTLGAYSTCHLMQKKCPINNSSFHHPYEVR